MNEVRKDDEQDMVDATNRELAKYKAHGLEETPGLQAYKGENGNITYGGGFKKGGHAQKSHEKINLKHCSVSTHEKNSKHKNW
jgi:hypothetical protein